MTGIVGTAEEWLELETDADAYLRAHGSCGTGGTPLRSVTIAN